MAGARGPGRLEVRRLKKGAALVLTDTDCCVVVLRGSCRVRDPENHDESVASGAVLLYQGDSNPSVDLAVARSLEKMALEPSKHWTVERLARSVGLSRAAFAKRFVRTLGVPPLQYLTELRLGLAADQLRSTDASLSELAVAVGYASEFAFSRAFKRRFGVAPSFFRRRARSAPSTVALLRAA